jgi:hypothetical protein
LAAIHGAGLGEVRQDTFRDARCAIAAAHLPNEQQELVAARPRQHVVFSGARLSDEVTRPHAALETFGDGLQHAISHPSPECIVDLLEAIEIEVQDGAVALFTLHAFQEAFHLFHEEPAVRQSRETVVVGQPVLIGLRGQRVS